MDSWILQIASRYISPVLIVFSIILLLRGHNHPGGGFAGGLIASIAFIVYCFAYGTKTALEKLKFNSRTWIISGLSSALAAGLPGIIFGQPFLKGKWISFQIVYLGEQHIGTPMLFDAGIYLLVIGVVATMIGNLAEE